MSEGFCHCVDVVGYGADNLARLTSVEEANGKLDKVCVDVGAHFRYHILRELQHYYRAGIGDCRSGDIANHHYGDVEEDIVLALTCDSADSLTCERGAGDAENTGRYRHKNSKDKENFVP